MVNNIQTQQFFKAFNKLAWREVSLSRRECCLGRERVNLICRSRWITNLNISSCSMNDSLSDSMKVTHLDVLARQFSAAPLSLILISDTICVHNSSQYDDLWSSWNRLVVKPRVSHARAKTTFTFHWKLNFCSFCSLLQQLLLPLYFFRVLDDCCCRWLICSLTILCRALSVIFLVCCLFVLRYVVSCCVNSLHQNFEISLHRGSSASSYDSCWYF